METDELQKRIAELCDINADLQVPFTIHPKSICVFCFALLHFYSASLYFSHNAIILFFSVSLSQCDIFCIAVFLSHNTTVDL